MDSVTSIIRRLKGLPSFEVSSDDSVKKDFLMEDSYIFKYSCVLVNLSTFFCDLSTHWAQWNLPSQLLAKDGIDRNPHITVKYGLHTSKVSDVSDLLSDFPIVRATVGKFKIFRNEEDYDVLVYEIISKDLVRLNQKVASLPCTTNFVDYLPHLTVAYVLPGSVDNWEGKSGPLTDCELVFENVCFSDRNGVHTSISLSNID